MRHISSLVLSKTAFFVEKEMRFCQVDLQELQDISFAQKGPCITNVELDSYRHKADVRTGAVGTFAPILTNQD